MASSSEKSRVTYVFDAYCGWCYGLGPAVRQFAQDHSDTVTLSVVSGGLYIGDRTVPMSTIPHLATANATIAERTGAVFDDRYVQFVTDGTFVMDSMDAAIGLAALRAQAPSKAVELASAMQSAFYSQGLSLSDPETYRDIARQFGLNSTLVVSSLFDPEVNNDARADFALARELGATSFPTLFFHGNDGSTVRFGSPTSTAAELGRDVKSCMRAYAAA
ncbi:putative protein-disulfide isomerase [Rhodococcus sp. 27YEA15]|uniref:DsbA family protein n=1 Tax=Rhodococcus sp. 27YEA15 TaxID=3156259 RepID=UPI003C799BCE